MLLSMDISKEEIWLVKGMKMGPNLSPIQE